VSVTGYAYDAAKNLSTANVVVGANATQMMLAFQQTVGGVKNVKVRRPGYAATDNLTTEFKQAVAPFSTIRFMDFTHTNDNPVSTWAERTTPAHASQGTVKGAAWEHAIQIANETGKDMWVNIPADANDAYIRSLATLLNSTLAPGRVVYVEYSNELWNFIFGQAQSNMLKAKGEAVAGDTSLTEGVRCTEAMFLAGTEPCNQYWAGYRRMGKMAVNVSKIFSEAMGPTARDTRFRVVYATQMAYRSMPEQTLKYIAKYHGAPSSFLYGIAGAPYYILTDAQAVNASLSADGIVAGLQSALTAILPSLKPGSYDGGDYREPTQKALADFYKIKSLGYEGGNDLLQSTVNIPNKVAANADPRAGAQTTEYLNQWFGCGNDLFMYFTLTSQWGQYGYWGLTNDPKNLNTAKYQAAKKVAESPRSTLCK
jgi:hypothetical protein